MAAGSGYHLRCKEEGAMRGNAGWGDEGDRLADTGLGLRGKLGKVHGASARVPKAEGGPAAARPLPAEAGEDRAGLPLTHLVGDLKRKQKKQFREGPFSHQRPASPATSGSGLTLALASKTGSLDPSMANVHGAAPPTQVHAPGATTTSASASRPGWPGARIGRGGAANQYFCVTRPYDQLNTSFKEYTQKKINYSRNVVPSV